MRRSSSSLSAPPLIGGSGGNAARWCDRYERGFGDLGTSLLRCGKLDFDLGPVKKLGQEAIRIVGEQVPSLF